MKAFFLFLITGIVTALPVMYMLAGAWMGVPVIATEYVSIAGSCMLIGSAYISLFSPKQASKFAFIGFLCVGSFWCVEPVKALWSGDVGVGLITMLAVVWIFIGVALTTSVKSIRIHRSEQVRIRTRKIILGVSASLLVTSIVAIEWQQKANERTPSRYEIPDGYVGWVEIRYEIAGFPITPVKNRQLVFTIPPSGLLKTNSAQQFGAAHDQYLYCATNGCKELLDTGWGKGGMIWGESSGTFQESGRSEVRLQHFFVGTESQYKKMQALSSMQEGIAPGDIRDKL
jgi:hypothetical protein